MMRIRTGFTGLLGSPYLMTTYWTATTENDAAAAVASNAVQAFLTAAKPHISNALSWATESAVAVLTPATGVQTAVLSGPVSNTGTGTASAGPLPEATQGHLTLRTSTVRLGRTVKGGLFIPGPTVTELAGPGSPTTTYKSDLGTASAAFFDPTTADLVVWSRPRTVPTVVAGSASLVTAITVTQKFAVLRSRRD